MKRVLAVTSLLLLGFSSLAFASKKGGDISFDDMPDGAFSQAIAKPAITNGVVSGNPNGKVTLVEFFDYNCMPCRMLTARLPAIEKANPDLKIVRIPVGVLSNSLIIAKYAMASRYEGNFAKFDTALLRAHPPLDGDDALAIATKVGLDASKLKKDITNTQVLSAMLDTTYAYLNVLSDGISVPIVVLFRSNPPYSAIGLIGGADNDKINQEIRRLAK